MLLLFLAVLVGFWSLIVGAVWLAYGWQVALIFVLASFLIPKDLVRPRSEP